MDWKDLERKIINDVAVEAAEEFDRNFERKAFFNQRWPAAKIHNGRGTLLNRTGNLRRSIKYTVSGGVIRFTSSLPYASIHNQGGEVIVTAKMKKYFWAMHYKAGGAIRTTSTGAQSRSRRNTALSAEAEKWKRFALMPVGQKIKIQKRQFIGSHPEITKVVKNIVDENVKNFNDELLRRFRR